MIKVAMIGAGSVVFSKNLTGDIFSYPEFRNATLCYMDIDRDRLEVGSALCRKVARALGADPKIEATLDLRNALRDADFVINMVQVGGFDSTLVDFEIPRKYGLNFTIADTTGPGGLFRALRTYPVLTNLCRQMEHLCPNALLLNYSNPMSMNLQTITRTSGVRAIGLCHSVQGTFQQLMDYIHINPGEVAFTCAGINHMAFYLRLEKDGQDLYPRLFEAMKDPAVYDSNRVRFELMKRLGYFVTESSEHNAEYNPYFMPHGIEQVHRFAVPIDEYLRRCDAIIEQFDCLKRSSRSDEPIEVHRSREYGSTIIHSMTIGAPSVVYGNMPNRGAIANLPENAIAEAPTLVDRAGPRLTTVGELPPQLIGYIQPHVTQHELFIRAAIEGRRDHVYQAAMFDPLTAATLTLDQIVEMCDELIAGHGFVSQGGLLPNLDAKRTLVPTSGKRVAPADPASLRAAWAQNRKQSAAEYIKSWQVIGPFPAERDRRNGLRLQTSVEDEFLRRGDGAVDLKATHRAGDAPVRWRAVQANDCGFVDLGQSLGIHEWSVAYAYTDITSSDARQALLRCGSDDGIRIWINGQVVHELEVGRAYCMDEDVVPIHLKPGINHIFAKIDNYSGGWGFGMAVGEKR